MRSFAAVVRAKVAPTIKVMMQPHGGGPHGGFGHKGFGGGREGFGGGRQGRGWGRAGGRHNSWKRKEDATPMSDSKGGDEEKSKVPHTQDPEQN